MFTFNAWSIAKFLLRSLFCHRADRIAELEARLGHAHDHLDRIEAERDAALACLAGAEARLRHQFARRAS